MLINEETKISALIKFNPDAIEAIASISKIFEKLRIPVLRRALASRVTIKQAAKIGGANIQNFYDKLAPLGFMVKETKELVQDPIPEIPDFYINLNPDKIKELDVRITLKEGKDPFSDIMYEVEKLPDGFTLNVINSFEPTPLINILSKKGYDHYVFAVNNTLVYTYFKRSALVAKTTKPDLPSVETSEMQDILKRYGNNIKKIDVRQLVMPLPMKTILDELATLPEETLLFVHHKRVPKFLFPELAEKRYRWSFKEIGEGNVELLIFK